MRRIALSDAPGPERASLWDEAATTTRRLKNRVAFSDYEDSSRPVAAPPGPPHRTIPARLRLAEDSSTY
jgi:hypothetical protein